MTRTAICGFEINDSNATVTNTAENIRAGSGTSYETTIVRSGTTALKLAAVSGTTGNAQLAFSFGNYNRIYLRVTARPATTARHILGSHTTNIGVKLNPDGTLTLTSAGVTVGTSTTALTDTTKWYRVEWRLADGSSVPVLLIDGATEVTASPSGWTMSAIVGTLDTVADTMTLYYDDLVVDDSAFPGAGNVILLLPTADDTRTNWTGGGGGTTNLWDAVNNTPPAGSSTDTNTNCITSNSTGGVYIATLHDYATRGMGASDTVNAIMQVVVHGEHVDSLNKDGTYELTQNPVETSTSFRFGNVTGNNAHGNYSAAPTKWYTSRKITSTPSVTASTAVKMKVVKSDANGNGCICFLGVYVDYTPNTGNATLAAALATVTAAAPNSSLTAASLLAGEAATATAAAPVSTIVMQALLPAEPAIATTAAPNGAATADSTFAGAIATTTAAAAAGDISAANVLVAAAGGAAATTAHGTMTATSTFAAACATGTAETASAVYSCAYTLAAAVTTATALAPAVTLTATAVLAGGAPTATAAAPAGVLAASYTLVCAVTAATAAAPEMTVTAASVLAAAAAAGSAGAPDGGMTAEVLLAVALAAATAAAANGGMSAASTLAATAAGGSSTAPNGGLAAASVLAAALAAASAGSPAAAIFPVYVATLTLAAVPLATLTPSAAPLATLTPAAAALATLTLGVNA